MKKYSTDIPIFAIVSALLGAVLCFLFWHTWEAEGHTVPAVASLSLIVTDWTLPFPVSRRWDFLGALFVTPCFLLFLPFILIEEKHYRYPEMFVGSWAAVVGAWILPGNELTVSLFMTALFAVGFRHKTSKRMDAFFAGFITFCPILFLLREGTVGVALLLAITAAFIFFIFAAGWIRALYATARAHFSKPKPEPSS